MAITTQAIYEQGVLRLTEPILLEEGACVEVIVITQKTQSLEKTSTEILAAIAAMPLETGNHDEFSSRDHDRVIYS
jgi:predicted DNA-binding antitoxin AbrB/MazE fold protein